MGRFADAAKKARDLTNKQLGAEISEIASGFSADQLEGLLPRKRDKEAFLELMRVVEEETEMDRKIAYLRDNIETAGRVALTVLGTLI